MCVGMTIFLALELSKEEVLHMVDFGVVAVVGSAWWLLELLQLPGERALSDSSVVDSRIPFSANRPSPFSDPLLPDSKAL